MRSGEDHPLRWRESTMDPRALAARAADLVDAVREEPPLAPEALARIEAEVLAQRSARRRGLPLGLRFALLTGAVLASVATAKGTVLLWRHYVLAPVGPAPAAQHLIAPAAPAGPARPVMSAPAVIPLEAPPSPTAEETIVTSPRPRHAAPAERRVGDDPTTEAQLLARALSRLRQGHDARGALKLLDQYASAHPRGVLASEALSARLEAVIQLNDRQAALRLLDGRSAFAGRLGAQQLLTRAELRASVGRYADALVDFDRVLAPAAGTATTPGNLERALYGRAVCLGHLGRDDRARADLETYRRRYPAGRYAAEVARLLGGAGRP
jgi:tetratricopeptide (TPR) repeat protein